MENLTNICQKLILRKTIDITLKVTNNQKVEGTITCRKLEKIVLLIDNKELIK